MKLLFIVDHDTDKNIDQVVMFVPVEYDRKRAIEVAQECGIPKPNILGEFSLTPEQANRIAIQVDEYSPYSR